jgi:glycosyltransferase involved in cell wall biosynthesis
VLYVGSLSKRKNFPSVLETACRLAGNRGYDFVFVGDIAGGISRSRLEIPDDVQSHITFAGQIDSTAALLQFYRRAKCFLFPSNYEASPLPPIEAMACGCPVVVSDIPSLRERCGDAAVYCNPADVDSIVAAVEQVMDDAALRSSLQELGRRQAAKYTWERNAERTLDLICGA